MTPKGDKERDAAKLNQKIGGGPPLPDPQPTRWEVLYPPGSGRDATVRLSEAEAKVEWERTKAKDWQRESNHAVGIVQALKTERDKALDSRDLAVRQLDKARRERDKARAELRKAERDAWERGRRLAELEGALERASEIARALDRNLRWDLTEAARNEDADLAALLKAELPVFDKLAAALHPSTPQPSEWHEGYTYDPTCPKCNPRQPSEGGPVIKNLPPGSSVHIPAQPSEGEE